MDSLLNSQKSFKQENLLQAILSNMNSLVAYLDTDCTYQYANSAYQDWFGLSAEEIIGKKLGDIVGENARTEAIPRIEAALSGTAQTFELEIPHRLGGFRYVQVNYNPDFSPDKTVQGVFVFVQDLTERHTQEKNLHERKRQFRKILDSVPAMIGFCDRELNVVAANKSYSEFYGVPLQGCIPVRQILGPKEFERLKPILMAALDGKPQWFEREIKPTDPKGITKHLLVKCNPEFDGDTVIGFYVTITETTEIKQLNEDLKRQHSFYSQILKSAQEGMVILNDEGKGIYWNNAAKNILELGPESEISRDQLKFFNEDGQPMGLDEFPAVKLKKTGEVQNQTLLSVLTENKRAKWLHVSAVPFSGSVNEQEAHVLVTFSDVTKKINRRRVLSSITQNVPGVIFQFHLGGQGEMSFPFLGPQAFSMFEITEEDRIRDPLTPMSLVHPEDMPELLKKIEVSASNLSPFEWSGRLVTKSAKTIWLTVKSIPRKEISDGITWDGIMLDVTNDHLMSQQLEIERNIAAQSSKLAALGEIAAGVAHEIHNPLAIISGMNQLLEQSKGDPEKFHKRIEAIGKACDRIEKIVGSLKKFARQDSKHERAHCKMSSIIDEVLSLSNIKAKKNRTELIVECNTTSSVQCASVEIEQILINLVSNAIDAVSGLEQKWVKIQALDRSDQVIVRVVDAGHGIPKEIAAKLFNPFFTTKEVGAGTGLGLSISLGIAKDHGGKIEIIDKEPNTCFELSLPKVA
jgi:PAS domain S-box-containing protein